MNRPTLLIGGGYDKGSSYDEWLNAFDGKVRYLVLIGQTREKIKEAKKKLHTSEQEHEEDEDNEYEEEIMNIVNEGHEQGAIMEGEARMITNIFEFGDKDVTDVMTSRKKIDAIDVNMSVEKALNYMLDEPYSRYPLYEDDIDNICKERFI